MRPLCIPLLLAMLSALPVGGRAQNLVANAGFENRLEDWIAFVPAESAANAPSATAEETNPHSGSFAVRLEARTSSRFALSSRTGLSVREGERYRVSAWYRASPGAKAAPGTPGLLLRANLSGDVPGVDIPAGHRYIGPSGAVSTAPGRDLAAPLAQDWALIEAVIQIPPGAKKMNLNLFAWSLAGTVWIDDVSVEPVPESTPATPLATGAPAASQPSVFPPASLPALAAGEERELAMENAGFEKGLQGWDAGSDHGMSQASPSAAYYGSNGLRVTDADPTRGSSLHGAYLPAVSGRLYHARFWGRIVSGDGAAAYLRFYDKDRRPLNTSESRNENLLFLPAQTSSFRQFVLEATAPPETAAVRIWLHSIGRSLVTADFDEFTLVEAQP